jgi:hypothetical protein
MVFSQKRAMLPPQLMSFCPERAREKALNAIPTATRNRAVRRAERFHVFLECFTFTVVSYLL